MYALFFCCSITWRPARLPPLYSPAASDGYNRQNINPPATFAAGELSVDFDLEPPALLEHLQFRARRNPQYYVDFIEEFNRSIAANG